MVFAQDEARELLGAPRRAARVPGVAEEAPRLVDERPREGRVVVILRVCVGVVGVGVVGGVSVGVVGVGVGAITLGPLAAQLATLRGRRVPVAGVAAAVVAVGAVVGVVVVWVVGLGRAIVANDANECDAVFVVQRC